MRCRRLLLVVPLIFALDYAPLPITDPETGRPNFLYDSIQFDIAYVGSVTPSQSTLTRFAQSLDYYRICREDSVSYRLRPALMMNSFALWSVPMLQQFEALNLGNSSNRSDVTNLHVFVAYVPGVFLTFEPGRNICGYAYKAASFAALRDCYSLKTQEVALFLHEFGHVMDLPGKDHCKSNKCLMHKYIRRNKDSFCRDCVGRISQLRERC